MKTINDLTRGWLGLVVLVSSTVLSCASTGPEAEDSVAAELGLKPGLVSQLRQVAPGFAVALVDEHGVLWSKGYGVANLRNRTPVTADTSFWLASVSKAVMGIAIAHAQERGLLSLDTEVRRLVATRAHFRIASPSDAALPLRELVTHTSPVRDSKFYACSYYFGPERGGQTSLFNAFRSVASDFSDPALADLTCDEHTPASLSGFLRSYLDRRGSYYSPDNFGSTGPNPVYSNVGAALAGYAFELATGRSLADYAKTNLFRPLGMIHTSWELDDLAAAEIASPYVWDEAHSRYVELPLYSLSTWPDGGLRSSARDLGRLLATIINAGSLNGTRILQPKSVEQMLTPVVSEDGVGFGIFWATFSGDSGQTLIGHDGGDPGAATQMYFDPVARVGVVLLTNTDDTRLSGALPDVLGELFESARRLHAARYP